MCVTKMESNPFVSVIVPVHNRPRELKRAIQSILMQTYTNYEIIIVDDCSTDNTFEVIQMLEKRDPRIKGYKNTKNGGGAYSRNQGVLKAKGELIAFLDSDDEWLPEKLERQLQYMKQCDENAVLITYFVVKKKHSSDKYGSNFIKTGNIRKELLMGRSIAWTSVILIRKEHFNRIGGFSDDLKSMQDFDLWIRLSEFYTCECLPEYLSIMHTDADVRISINPNYRIDGIEVFLKKWAPVITREVGSEYVDLIRSRHLGSVYYHAAIAALKQKDRILFFSWFKQLLAVKQLRKKRLFFILINFLFSFFPKKNNSKN